MEKEMATHSSILAWRILWTEEPGGLPSMGSHRVGPSIEVTYQQQQESLRGKELRFSSACYWSFHIIESRIMDCDGPD